MPTFSCSTAFHQAAVVCNSDPAAAAAGGTSTAGPTKLLTKPKHFVCMMEQIKVGAKVLYGVGRLWRKHSRTSAGISQCHHNVQIQLEKKTCRQKNGEKPRVNKKVNTNILEKKLLNKKIRSSGCRWHIFCNNRPRIPPLKIQKIKDATQNWSSFSKLYDSNVNSAVLICIQNHGRRLSQYGSLHHEPLKEI